ncbi:MAG: YciI family protein [Segniliparus sp.]|uniref:YciI family protein n=1 Tax=Segniliparus sp. TaxID=2804064 RepID=UPI003F2D1A08
MAQYMLSIVYPEDAVQPPQDELAAIMRDARAVTREMQDAGVWIFSAGLEPADTAAVVTAHQDDLVTTVDGPYAETKEQLGGFNLVEVPDQAEARRWAAEVSRAVRCPVEVRGLAPGCGNSSE